MAVRRCSECKDAGVTTGFGTCDPCADALADRALNGAKCTDPLIHDRVAAILWPRHTRRVS